MTAFQGITQPIRLDSSVQRMLGKHLLTCYPHEACGILLGAAAAGGMYIKDYIPMHNVAPDPLHTFVPDPQEWVKALYNKPAPIGLFHSHPHSAPWPSSADLRGLSALGPEFKVYLIGAPEPDASSGNALPVLRAFHIKRQIDASGKPINSLLQYAPLYVLLK